MFWIGLTSCSLLWQNKDAKTQEKNTLDTQTGVLGSWVQTIKESVNTKNNEDINQSKEGVNSWSGKDTLLKWDIVWSKNEHAYSIESLDKITSHEEIKLINPIMDQEFPGDNTPEYTEFQKNQLKLGLLISQIQDPEYIKLRNQQKDIREWKAIWTQKVSKADAQLEEAMKHIEEVSSKWETMKLLVRKRAQAMAEFQASDAYMQYIKENKDRLASITESMEHYYTPEIQELQKKINQYMNSHTWVMLQIAKVKR